MPGARIALLALLLIRHRGHWTWKNDFFRPSSTRPGPRRYKNYTVPDLIVFRNNNYARLSIIIIITCRCAIRRSGRCFICPRDDKIDYGILVTGR